VEQLLHQLGKRKKRGDLSLMKSVRRERPRWNFSFKLISKKKGRENAAVED